MAYTYENFTTAANNAGLLSSFSEDDLAIAKTSPEYGLSLLNLRQEYANAKTAEQKLLAQEAENQLRSSYGSLTTAAPTSFTYGKQTEYQKLLDEVSNYQPFEYDPATDPAYGSYKKAYLREADRATQDTMAQASAMSGGRPSSFAVSAAQQAGNYYRGQLNDAIPTLQQNAYQRYLNDYNANLSALGALNTDRTFDYNAYLTEYEQEQQAWNNAFALYQALGYATPEIAAILGIPAANTGGAAGGSSGSGGGDLFREPVEEQIEDDSTGDLFLDSLLALYPNGVVGDESIMKDAANIYGAGVLAQMGIKSSNTKGTVGAGIKKGNTVSQYK